MKYKLNVLVLIEIDPLLPQNPSAPEISGYGFSPGPEFNISDQRAYHTNDDEAAEERSVDESSSQIGTNTSPLRAIVAIFTIVIGLAIFLTLLVPGGLGSPWGTPGNRNPTLGARTDRILSQTPLIGV